MIDYEKIVKELLRCRACIEGVAKESEEAYKILARDLEVLFTRELRRG